MHIKNAWRELFFSPSSFLLSRPPPPRKRKEKNETKILDGSIDRQSIGGGAIRFWFFPHLTLARGVELFSFFFFRFPALNGTVRMGGGIFFFFLLLFSYTGHGAKTDGVLFVSSFLSLISYSVFFSWVFYQEYFLFCIYTIYISGIDGGGGVVGGGWGVGGTLYFRCLSC